MQVRIWPNSWQFTVIFLFPLRACTSPAPQNVLVLLSMGFVGVVHLLQCIVAIVFFGRLLPSQGQGCLGESAAYHVPVVKK